MRVSYFGPTGTFTEMALDRFERDGLFADVERVSAASPGAALEAVRSGAAEGAVVPIENSIQGAVPATLDGLVQGSRLQIVAENELDITFTVLTATPMSAADIRTVCGYPHATGQVRDWLERTLPHAELQFAASNSAAAVDVSQGRADAAISTSLAGQQLGLHTFADGVSDVADARTRFIYVTTPGAPPAATGGDRTSVVVEPTNAPGALNSALTEFAIRGVDLTFIESRPTKVLRGTYRFFLECSGHLDDPLVGEVLEALHRKMPVLFLGSWPSCDGQVVHPPGETLDSQAWVERMRRGRPE